MKGNAERGRAGQGPLAAPERDGKKVCHKGKKGNRLQSWWYKRTRSQNGIRKNSKGVNKTTGERWKRGEKGRSPTYLRGKQEGRQKKYAGGVTNNPA